MREIKFRVWNTYLQSLVLTNQTIEQLHKDFLLECDMNGFSDYILMQYTGLRDKNGVEIYEGDILRWRDDYLTRSKLVHVDTELFAALILESLKDNKLELEVLGNIYENPELLSGDER